MMHRLTDLKIKEDIWPC